ncbi:hypothetical protein [Nitrosomonas halophila]|uniref:Uncharacterized protein n=1 Tax=Nitrosomonas halophila TaxID=44576 RepID=A0A1H3JND0_9PROT|nr:hypothetical protein [Nitrosomonas halophila]SDY41500.1 hypothetical protein SAMN05421881_103420 [Nitrosomonas halophila]
MEEVVEKSEEAILDECIQHATEVLAEQLPHIKDKKKYDFAPQFKEMTIQLYLVGVMWKFYTRYETAENALEKAYGALAAIMAKDGIKPKRVEKQVAFIRKVSKLEDDEALATALGYESKPGDRSLAAVFDQYLDDVRVSGSLWRYYDNGKKILLLGGLLFAMIGVWFVTIFLPESDDMVILAVGLLMAFLFMIPVSLIGLLIYRYKIKKGERSDMPSS